MARVYILHENPVWFAPLGEALAAQGVPYEQVLLDKGVLDLRLAPPEGVYFNRLSGSAHTRGHARAVEHARVVLRWLERHGRRVVNGGEALELAMSKSALLTALDAAGIRTPRTRVAVGEEEVPQAAAGFDGPFLVKPNRSGKGIGIRYFESREALGRALEAGPLGQSIDGVWVVQEYLAPAGGHINRLEFVGGELLYALQSEAGHGFNLCPADDCRIPEPGAGPRFAIRRDFAHPLVAAYRGFLRRHGIEIAAIEFLTDGNGTAYTYDLNINTNYNAAAEAEAGLSGMAAIAAFLGAELGRLEAAAVPVRRAAAAG